MSLYNMALSGTGWLDIKGLQEAVARVRKECNSPIQSYSDIEIALGGYEMNSKYQIPDFRGYWFEKGTIVEPKYENLGFKYGVVMGVGSSLCQTKVMTDKGTKFVEPEKLRPSSVPKEMIDLIVNMGLAKCPYSGRKEG